MNVEGDFRYVDPGAFDECSNFLEYLDGYRDDWEEAFVNWISVSTRWKEDRKLSQNYWGPWNLVKVLNAFVQAKLLSFIFEFSRTLVLYQGAFLWSETMDPRDLAIIEQYIVSW